MYKAIIFDFFEVLIEDTCWNRIYSNADTTIQNQLLKINVAANLGDITWNDFCEKLAEIDGTTTDVIFKEYDSLQINKELLKFIQKINTSYHISLFTNASSGYVQQAIQKFSLNDVFDNIVISSEIHDMKPNASAFNSLVTIIEQDYQSCIFIDDNINNIDTAAALGMKTIHFKNTKETIMNLEELLHV